jgi:VIT1/CCC1 family predicted Fe2+/Mn2+ transporter
MARTPHHERHRTDRIGWLQAAVLGANGGIVSTDSLSVGVAAANASHENILVTGITHLLAGCFVFWLYGGAVLALGRYPSIGSTMKKLVIHIIHVHEALGMGLEYARGAFIRFTLEGATIVSLWSPP